MESVQWKLALDGNKIWSPRYDEHLQGHIKNVGEKVKSSNCQSCLGEYYYKGILRHHIEAFIRSWWTICARYACKNVLKMLIKESIHSTVTHTQINVSRVKNRSASLEQRLLPTIIKDYLSETSTRSKWNQTLKTMQRLLVASIPEDFCPQGRV